MFAETMANTAVTLVQINPHSALLTTAEKTYSTHNINRSGLFSSNFANHPKSRRKLSGRQDKSQSIPEKEQGHAPKK
jgi:hypothetical protein